MLALWNNNGGVSSLMRTAAFILPLYDKGAGEVDLTLYRGTGSATFTRATTATTINSAGSIISVASGVPRSCYYPDTLAYRGVLNEPAATNLVLNSLLDGTDFSTKSVTVAAVAYTLSFYGTGTITLSGVSTAGPLVGTGVYPNRVTLTFTPTAGSLTLTVSGSCKYVQLETGSIATSFIPTAGASVTRNADVLTYPFAGNADAAQGSCYAEVSTNWSTLTTIQAAVSLQDRGVLYTDNAAATTIRTSDGVNSALKTGLTSMQTAVRKRASSWGAAGLIVTGDGADVATGTFDGDMGSTAIGIGQNAAATNRWFNGCIKEVRIFPSQLTAAQLQAITG
jgi:hypothetical protein